jgi:KaiC/GvpD/RAD55 family RecA-like ATPase
MALQTVVVCISASKERFSDINDIGRLVDDKFDGSSAIEFLEKRGVPFEDDSELDYCAPYSAFTGWTDEQLRLLEAENKRRKRLRETWQRRAQEIADYLLPLGGLTAIGSGFVATADEHEFWQPVILCIAVDGLPSGESLEFIKKVSGDDVAIEFVDTSVEDCWLHLDEPIRVFDGDNPLVYLSHKPNTDETWRQCAEREPLDQARCDTLLDAYRRSGGSAELLARLMAAHSGRNDQVEFVVDGLFPRQAVTLLIGPPKIGKSTLALQAAVDVADGDPFLGFATHAQHGDALVVFLSGEDPQNVISTRIRVMSLNGENGRLVPLCDMSSVNEALKLLDTVDVAFVVVDTAAAFVGASVNDGGPAREFMGTLGNFAKAKNCAVLVVHHTNKGVTPRSSKATLDGMKGSSEFTSAARVILTLHTHGDRRILNVALHNMPSSVGMFDLPLALSYDPSTERHTVDDEGPAPLPSAPEAATSERVSAAKDAEILALVVRRERAKGRPVALSGKNEPYTFRAHELAGWQRTRVRAAHRAAIEAGLISDKGDGFGAAAAE